MQTTLWRYGATSIFNLIVALVGQPTTGTAITFFDPLYNLTVLVWMGAIAAQCFTLLETIQRICSIVSSQGVIRELVQGCQLHLFVQQLKFLEGAVPFW